MEDYEILYLTSSTIYFIFQLVVIVACALLLSKSKSFATILIFVGSLLSLLFTGFSFLGIAFIAKEYGAEVLAKTNGIISILSQIPHILFAIGLMLFVVQYRKKQSSHKNI